MMAGLDWQALPIIAEILGIEDVEGLVLDLLTMRTWNSEQTNG